jgi:hypothetical protein
VFIQIWDLFEGCHLFAGIDTEHQRYRSRAHLAEMVALLENPPQDLLDIGKSSSKFFTDEGQSLVLLTLGLSFRPLCLPRVP